MTREEVYSRIDAIIAKYEIDDEYVTIANPKDYEALRIARKFLEQEPCEDCISRQAVLAIAGDSYLDLDSYEDTREFCDEIKALPPVTPQPKIGHGVE